MADIGRTKTDQELVRSGRKDKLEGVEASLRDQIPQKLLKRLRMLKLGRQVTEDWNIAEGNRQDWKDRQEEYLKNWDEYLISTDAGPFVGSSTLHMPWQLIAVKTLHARFFQALVGSSQPLKVIPTQDHAPEKAKFCEGLMLHAVKKWANYREGVEDIVDLFLIDWLTTGSGVLKLRWDVKYSKFVDVEEFEQIAVQTEIDEEGNLIEVPTSERSEREVERVNKDFEGPVFDLVRPEDIVIIGGMGNPQRADKVIQRCRMTASQLWTLVDRGIFDEGAVEKMIKAGDDGQHHDQLKQTRAENAGYSGAYGSDPVEETRYTVYEAHCKVDINESGIGSDVIMWVSAETDEILSANFLRRVNKSGERPFFKADFHRRPGQEWGTGIVEILHPVAKELDAMHNMRIDFGLISTMPMIFYRPSSGIEPKEIQYSPGMMFPVNDPTSDIMVPNFGNRTSFGFQEEASLQSMVERLTNISDLSLGIMSGQQGATRTATGTRALVGESSANLDVHLRRLNKAWSGALNYLWHMLQQRTPKGLAFRITGVPEAESYMKVNDRNDLELDADIEVSSNSSDSNKQINIERKTAVLQAVSDPLDIQLGIITPRARYEAKKAYLEALGEKDVNRFLQAPPDQRIFSPMEEINRLLNGQPTPVGPEGDHEGFLAYWQQLQQDPEILSQFSDEDIQAVQVQAAQHQEMQQAMEEMAAVQRDVSQQARNANLAGQQAPLGEF